MSTSLLILDGDLWRRESLAAALAYEGCHAEHTGEATFAMALLAGHRHRLVLIDPSAPATGGWKTIEHVALLYPTLPVIVIGSDDEASRSAPVQGRIDIMKKPIVFTTLLSAIQRILSTSQQHVISRHP